MSKILDAYIIHFKGLAVGNHIFEFDVNDNFFGEFERSEVLGGDVYVEVELIKHTTMLELNFFIEGDVTVKCDRCLESLSLPIEFDGKLVVRITDSVEEGEENDEIWFIKSNVDELALGQYIYESICLSLPIQRYHGLFGTSESDCDKEMLSKLQELTDHSGVEIKNDSRWDKLKDIISN